MYSNEVDEVKDTQGTKKKSRRIVLYGVLLVIIFLSNVGCMIYLYIQVTQLRAQSVGLVSDNLSLTAEVENLQGQIAELSKQPGINNEALSGVETQIEDVQTDVGAMVDELTSLSNSVKGIIKLSSGDYSAELNLADATYDAVTTDEGYFLFVVESVSAYLDGSRLYLKVGNPMSATYNNLSVSINYSDNGGNMYSAETIVSEPVAAGSWTHFSVILPEVTPENLESATAYVDIKSVDLNG